MWSLVVIEVVYIHLFLASVIVLLYFSFWASTRNPILYSMAVVIQFGLFYFQWWALDGIVDLRIIFRTVGQQREWERFLVNSDGMEKNRAAPQFSVDLNASPSERWICIVRLYCENGQAEIVKDLLVGYLIHIYGKFGATMLCFLLRIILTAHARFSLPPVFREELLGISIVTTPYGLHYFDLLLLNYGGDFLIFPEYCNANRESNTAALHCSRYIFSYLKIKVDFRIQNHSVFSGETLVFLVGAHSMKRSGGIYINRKDMDGKKINEYCMTSKLRELNDKDMLPLLSRIVSSDACHWPQGMLVRYIVEFAEDYQQAIDVIVSLAVLSACTIELSATRESVGVVIEHDGGNKIRSYSKKFS